MTPIVIIITTKIDAVIAAAKPMIIPNTKPKNN